MNRKKNIKMWALFFLVLSIIFTIAIVVAITLKWAKTYRLLNIIPLTFCPLLVFLCTILWARDLQKKPTGPIKSSPTPAFAILSIFAFYIILTLLFAPAYCAVIGLGDRLVRENGVEIDKGSFSDLAYFSVVTASTLGYGDITPEAGSNKAYLLVCVQVVQFWAFFAVALSFLYKHIKINKD